MWYQQSTYVARVCSVSRFHLQDFLLALVTSAAQEGTTPPQTAKGTRIVVQQGRERLQSSKAANRAVRLKKFSFVDE